LEQGAGWEEREWKCGIKIMWFRQSLAAFDVSQEDDNEIVVWIVGMIVVAFASLPRVNRQVTDGAVSPE
jgi:hypothetical protein